MTIPQSWFQQTLAWIRGDEAVGASGPPELGQTLGLASPGELEVLCEALQPIVIEDRAFGGNDLEDRARGERIRKILQAIASRLVAGARGFSPATTDQGDSPVSAATLSQLYFDLSSRDSVAAAHVLQCLAAQADEESLAALAFALNRQPPPQWTLVGLGLSPLWKLDSAPLEFFFERLEDDSLTKPVLCTVILDLANHAVRSRRLKRHPLLHMQASLVELLRQLCIRLEKLARDPRSYGEQVEEVQRILADSTALCVSLCDGLGLMGVPEATAALAEALDLPHRRIQTEAAAALARLGDARGVERLIELASDPVARRQAVQYAEELEIADRIDQRYLHPAALAESELATWLASPMQFAVGPQAIELVDSRTLYWPGFEEPRDCYLFRYRYQLPDRELVNLGIAGPLVHSFADILTGLILEDAYAAFAGWQLDHEEIYEVAAEHWNVQQQREAHRLSDVLTDAGYQIVQPIALTYLLGQPALLAKIKRDEQIAVGIADQQTCLAFPTASCPINLSPQIVLAIYRGRQLLSAFNPGWDAEAEDGSGATAAPDRVDLESDLR
ncbi:MAG: HEAT repeat domain-containing protein [Pirellulaceae bacterium]|nr:HEAT repeat domain-containing protein [Pirellulaceae bacterium]